MSISQIQHYRISSPLDTHFRVGTCEEDHCQQYLHGWDTILDEGTSLGAEQAAYIRGDRSRQHAESAQMVQNPPVLPGQPPVAQGLRTVFHFEPGTRCFRQHRVPIDKPELYLVQNNDGDILTRHSGPDAWRDDFCTNQDRLADLINRG